MNAPLPERRRISYSTLLESAMRSANQLYSSQDPGARYAANRVLSDLQKLHAEMPTRRIDDNSRLK